MVEIPGDDPHPQLFSGETISFLSAAMLEFEAKQPLEQALGKTAVAHEALVGRLYDGLLVCLTRADSVRSKRRTSRENEDFLQQPNVYAQLLTVGSLAPLIIASAAPDVQPYIIYSEQLTQLTTDNLEQLGFGTIDDVIQHLRGESSQYVTEI